MIGITQAAVHAEFRLVQRDLREREAAQWALQILALRGDGDEVRALATALGIGALLEQFCYTQFTGQAPRLDERLAIDTLTDLIGSGLLANT